MPNITQWHLPYIQQNNKKQQKTTMMQIHIKTDEVISLQAFTLIFGIFNIISAFETKF
jgi:hypothetical protein